MSTEKKQWVIPQATEIEVNSGSGVSPIEGDYYGPAVS
jgi:hypothetical protein